MMQITKLEGFNYARMDIGVVKGHFLSFLIMVSSIHLNYAEMRLSARMKETSQKQPFSQDQSTSMEIKCVLEVFIVRMESLMSALKVITALMSN
jgi:hypothetical protein